MTGDQKVTAIIAGHSKFEVETRNTITTKTIHKFILKVWKR